MSDIFQEAVNDLEEIAKAERRRIREESKIDDMPEHLQEQRVLEREALLPKNRVCPRCLEQKLDARKWVVLVNGVSEPQRWRQMLTNYRQRRARAISRSLPPPNFDIMMVCRSCTMIEPQESKGNPFTPIVYVVLNSRAVKVRRYGLDLTSTVVAEACGWSQAKQSKIESRDDYKILYSEAEKLQQALDLTELPVVGDPDVRYKVDPIRLKAMRLAAGASRRLVASWLDVSTERYRHFESTYTTVQGRIAKTITRGFVRMTSGDATNIDVDTL